MRFRTLGFRGFRSYGGNWRVSGRECIDCRASVVGFVGLCCLFRRRTIGAAAFCAVFCLLDKIWRLQRGSYKDLVLKGLRSKPCSALERKDPQKPHETLGNTQI